MSVWFSVDRGDVAGQPGVAPELARVGRGESRGLTAGCARGQLPQPAGGRRLRAARHHRPLAHDEPRTATRRRRRAHTRS